MEAIDLLQRLFPGSGAPATFAVLGGVRPRWIVPVGKPQIARLLSSWRPYKLSSRLGWHALCGAARGGLLHHLPGVKTFTAQGGDWRDFGWEAATPPLTAFYVGTAGPQQKLIALLADAEDGTPRLIVKFPLGARAWRGIAHEYETLQCLQAEKRFPVPAPVHLDTDKRFAAQSWLEGAPVGTGITKAHIAFLGALRQPGATIALEPARAALLEKRARLIASGGLPAMVADEIKTLLSGDDWRGTVPAVRIHGDFAPWNLKRLHGRAITALDWEESADEGLPFYDLFFYQRQVKRLLGRHVDIPLGSYKRLLFGDAEANTSACEALARAGVVMAVEGQYHDHDS